MTDIERYLRAIHAMQSGVALEMSRPERASATEPKHLRVGINANACSHSALVRLLMAKGVINEQEYFAALADAMEAEQRSYEERNGVRLA